MIQHPGSAHEEKILPASPPAEQKRPLPEGLRAASGWLCGEATGKLAYRKVLYGRQEGHGKGCRHRPKWSMGHGGIRPIEP